MNPIPTIGLCTILTAALYSAFDLLRHPTVTPEQLIPAVPALANVDPHILTRVHIDGRYNAHLRRQEADLRVFQDDEGLLLDPQMDYSVVEGLSSEVKERLARVRPANIVSTTFSPLRSLVCVW